MKSSNAGERLREICASQWGLVTTAQAGDAGVPRIALTRLAQSGKYERLAQGVYRDTAVPSSQYDYLRGAWLSLNPSQSSEERVFSPTPDAVVCRETAAWLLGYGTFVPEPYRFATPARRQTQRPELRLYRKQYPKESLEICQGLPVTSFEQTVADLVEAEADLSLVSDMFSELPLEAPYNQEKLIALLSPFAEHNGFTPGDGESFYKQLAAPRLQQIKQLIKKLKRSEGTSLASLLQEYDRYLASAESSEADVRLHTQQEARTYFKRLIDDESAHA
ncbi:hypothetical protein KIM372_13610 [Bombiscardovia nodaiensis]|uniref:AbiEi antitoxin N-terminal domain-containing protein n=1 Tax=Bombiscardovia nodaiensis TaxID=2932181 RepID=A0ABM8B9G2_9BIFI|nr:hypothetical protein KIM372_13610 [Bombiscardovia nodaiensis]